MKFLIVAAVLFVAAVQGQSYGYGVGGRGIGGQQSSGGSFGDSGFQSSHQGYTGEGHQNNLYNNVHNNAHSVNDFDATVHKHQETDHNAGGTVGINNAGHSNGEYGSFQNGHNRYGNNWNQGYGV